MIQLAELLYKRSELKIENLADLDGAIKVMEKAIGSVPSDHPDRAGWPGNLSIYLGERFARTGSHDDLNRSIESGKQAAAGLSQNHRDRGRTLNILGNRYLQRHVNTQSTSDIDQALVQFRAAWACRNTDPTMRTKIALNAARVLASFKTWTESSKFFKDAVHLIPRMSPSSLQHTDKQHVLSDFAGLSSLAAAVALKFSTR